MTDITNLVKNLRHWAKMASLTSEQVSCLSVQQLETIANELDSAHQLIVELESFRTAYMEWSNKTDWVRDDRRFDVVKPLGKHLADVLKAYIEHLEPRTVTVDADVSDRNQPGMVVAVHIDAGDFVKFKGQVYEVKETDFDDHDVTLWFVCGEVLKCAAGCPIEVVSAPVEDE